MSENPTEPQRPKSGGPNKESATDRPGVLRGRATLTLQTRHAQRLVKGRAATAEKPAIIGLIGFAHLLRTIWHGARADDPYADWWMLKVHAALESAQQDVVAREQQIAELFQTAAAVDVALAASVKPARIALNFSNPYAFHAARLVGLYDGFVCTVLSAQHVGLVTRTDSERASHLGGRPVRRALQSALGYRFTGVTRQDLVQGTAKAQQAAAAMGVCPDDVLVGTHRAPHAPSPVGMTAPPAAAAIDLRPLPDLT